MNHSALHSIPACQLSAQTLQFSQNFDSGQDICYMHESKCPWIVDGTVYSPSL